MKIAFCIPAAVLFVVLSFISCSNKSTNSGGQVPPARQSIGPAGGTIQISNQVTLLIPAGSLSDTVIFSIAQDDAPVLPGGTNRFVSTCYSIEPSGTQFSLAAGLTIKYDPSNLGRGNESAITICSHDSAGWLPLTTTVDTAGNWAVAVVNHLCSFVALVDTATAHQGCFAALAVGRTITVLGGVPIRLDVLAARFDSAYAPCVPVLPLRPDSVGCNQFILAWDQTTHEYSYYDYMHPEFISLDSTYAFHVKGNATIPNLTASISFPDEEPYITSPAFDDTLSLTGFTMNWAGSGAGTVRIIMMKDNDTTNVIIETGNDGSYSFTANQLSGLQPGDYGLIMIHQNTVNINATGYDSRSFLWARVLSTTFIHFR